MLSNSPPAAGEWIGTGARRYTLQHGPWVVHTYVDTAGRTHQLCYDHRISAGNRSFLLERTSLLCWLGIAGQTDWSDVFDSDAEELVASFGKICRHFLNALPGLLNDLPCE